MLYKLIQTNSDYAYLFLRIVAGIIIFPYGMQKLLGWFDDFGGGVGTKATLNQLYAKHVPKVIAWLIIIGQSFGSIALLVGCFGRFAAAANFIIFTGAIVVHASEGWAMNWLGKKKGKGIEYFILLLSILLLIILKGSGPLSIDHWLQSIIQGQRL